MPPEPHAQRILERIRTFPRVALIHRPTPLRRLPRLSAQLGGPEIFIKRDDLTGLAFGGNKSRKLEFIVGDMLQKKADVVITWASVQSNWCLQTAAAARMHGLRPVLVLFNTSAPAPEVDGNLLLDVILGADVRIREAEKGRVVKAAQALDLLEVTAGEFRDQGLRPYVVPVGGSLVGGDMDKPWGAISYVEAFAEMLNQTAGEGFVPDYVFHATGSGGTQGGLVVGAKTLTEACRVVGISVSDPKGPFSEDVLTIARAAAEMLGSERDIGPGDVIVHDDYVGAGYGAIDSRVADMIRLVFQTEGIVLDPVYTAKAMAGLVDLARQGAFRKTDRVVFFHTGGTPALFPHRSRLLELLPGGTGVSVEPPQDGPSGAAANAPRSSDT